jgi:hypothetical protein
MADEAVVCVKCGVPVGKGNQHCPKCGCETHPDAVICVHCGINLENKKTNEEDIWKSLQSLREIFDNLPFIATLLLVLFADGIFGGLYRVTKGDTTGIVLGVLWFVTGGLFGVGVIIDLISVAVHKKITFLT